MKKTSILVASLLLLTTLTLAGCGTKQAGSDTSETTKPAPSAKSAPSDEAVKEGTAKLIRTAKQLREAITAGDEAKIKELGSKLEEAWSSFEDGVKPKYPDLYEKVEQNLDPAIAGTKASPIDKETLSKLDDQLIQVLYDLSQKLIPVNQIKAGASQMIGLTNDLKNEMDKANEAKINEIGSKLEETWSTFEDGVRPRNADLYEKIEKSLNPEVAGSQKIPVDKQALTQLNDSLAQALNELLQILK